MRSRLLPTLLTPLADFSGIETKYSKMSCGLQIGMFAKFSKEAFGLRHFVVNSVYRRIKERSE